MPGRSTSIQRSVGGSGMRHGRASSPAARLSTVSTPPFRTRSRMISSKTAVRTIIGQAICRPRGIVSTMPWPFSPASRAANGSRKMASGRSLSMARYTATQRAVSETFSILLMTVKPEPSGLGRQCCVAIVRMMHGNQLLLAGLSLVPPPSPLMPSRIDRALVVGLSLCFPAALTAQTRMLRSPTVSKTQIAFAYANNIWVVDRSGGNARRLTSIAGTSENPKFSPDGKLIAFSASYGGNVDVYVVPADGGEPKRLTWHPGADVVQGWTPDGKNIVFNSSRATEAPSAAPRFWTVPVEGGVETPMPLPRDYQGKISPDGRRVAYRMNNSWDEERRNYRGGQNRPIWIVDLKTFDLDSTPNTTSDMVVAQAGAPRGPSHFSAPSTPESKNMDPVWASNDVVDFISDRDGIANVWSFDTKSRKLNQLTDFSDFDVKTLDAASDGSAIVFEQAGDIHLLDPHTGKQHVVQITAEGDFPWMMPQWKDVT